MSPPTNHPSVARGAALLDQRQPGWHRQVDLHRLDAHRDDYLDVLTQLYGDDYERAISILYQPETAATTLVGGWGLIPAATSWAIGHGFDIDPPVRDVIGAYAQLADAWRTEITKRLRAEAGPAA
jgi:hypothetical protein